MLGLLGGGIGSAASFGMGGAGGIFGFLTSSLGGLSRGLTGLAALLTGAVVGGLTSFVGALAAAARSTMEYSRAVIDLRNQTGMSTSAAQRMAGQFGAFGMKPGELGNGGQFFGLTQLIGRMWRVDPSNPASINARSQSFGGGLMGFTMRNAMLSAIGMNNPNGQFLANLPQGRVQEQLDYQSRIQKSMGIGPEEMRKYAEDFPLIAARIGMVVDAIKMKFAAVALPVLERGFTWLADFLAAKGPQITEAIYNVVSWLYADAPVLLVQGLQTLIKAGVGFADFFANLGHSIAGQMRIFEKGEGALYSVVKSIAGLLDNIIDLFTDFGAAMANARAMFANVVAASIDLMPGGRLAAKALGFEVPKYTIPGQAGLDYYEASKPSNLVGMLDEFRKSGQMGRWADSLDAGANNLSSFAHGHGNTALTYLDGVLQKLGTRDERREDFKAMTAELQKANQLLQEGNRIADQTNQKMGGFGQQTISRVLAYIAEDTYLANAAG